MLVCLAVLVLWLPDLDLPLGNSDDGRLVAGLAFKLETSGSWGRWSQGSEPVQTRM